MLIHPILVVAPAATDNETDSFTNWNDEPRPFVWPKTADEILDTLAS